MAVDGLHKERFGTSNDQDGVVAAPQKGSSVPAVPFVSLRCCRCLYPLGV